MVPKLHTESIKMVGQESKCTVQHEVGDERVFRGRTPGVNAGWH